MFVLFSFWRFFLWFWPQLTEYKHYYSRGSGLGQLLGLGLKGLRG